MSFINFNQLDDEGNSSITKPALIFVEGQHTDSSKRTHHFTKDRIERIVANTNDFLRKGARIPFQLDHKKDQLSNIGDVESEFYTKVITEVDLPNPKHKHLLGRLGVFVDKIVAKGKDAVQKIIDKKITTLSPGIDPATESFIEISATPIPAIIGPSLFSKEGDNVIYFESSFMGDGNMGDKYTNSPIMGKKAYSFDDLEQLSRDMDEVREEYNKYAGGLFKILSDLYSSSEEELQGLDPLAASYDAIETFIEKVEEMFDLVMEEDEDEEGDQTSTGSSRKFPIGVQPSDYSRGNLKTVGFIRTK
jgi:hypothetical protein